MQNADQYHKLRILKGSHVVEHSGYLRRVKPILISALPLFAI